MPDRYSYKQPDKTAKIDNTECEICDKDQQYVWRIKQIEETDKKLGDKIEANKEKTDEEFSEIVDDMKTIRKDFAKEISGMRNMLLVTMTSACLSLLGVVIMLLGNKAM